MCDLTQLHTSLCSHCCASLAIDGPATACHDGRLTGVSNHEILPLRVTSHYVVSGWVQLSSFFRRLSSFVSINVLPLTASALSRLQKPSFRSFPAACLLRLVCTRASEICYSQLAAQQSHVASVATDTDVSHSCSPETNMDATVLPPAAPLQISTPENPLSRHDSPMLAGGCAQKSPPALQQQNGGVERNASSLTEVRELFKL